jgi:DNA-directed RNA polymerase specialized sigma24 family protein
VWQRPPRFPSREAVQKVLARLEAAELSPEERAVLVGIAEQYLEIMELAQKPGVTVAELRSRVRIVIK